MKPEASPPLPGAGHAENGRGASNRPVTIPPGRSRESGWLFAAFGAATALLIGFGVLADLVLNSDTTAVDRRIFLLFRDPTDLTHAIGPAWLPEAMRDLTGLGSTLVLGLILVAALGYLFLAKKRGALLLVLVSVLGGQLISTLLKIAFARPRPDLVANAPHVFTASFPSGHATLSAATYLTLGALLTRLETTRALKGYLIALSVFLTVAVGVSRVYVGVHWPTDVLGGWCVGSAWAIFCWAVASWLRRRVEV